MDEIVMDEQQAGLSESWVERDLEFKLELKLNSERILLLDDISRQA